MISLRKGEKVKYFVTEKRERTRGDPVVILKVYRKTVLWKCGGLFCLHGR